MADPTYRPVSNPFSVGDDFPSTAVGVTLPGGVAPVFCDYPHTAEVGFKTVVQESWSGAEKRSAKGAARLRFVLRFEQIPVEDGDALWNHYLAQLGQLHAFTYIDYLSGESFTVRYAKEAHSRETYLFEAERTGIEMIEVL